MQVSYRRPLVTRVLSARMLGTLALCAVLIIVVVACGGEQRAEPFRVGVMESLTGPGETYGTVANQAKQMAADEINAAGGINGRLLELVVEDSQCSAKEAVTAYTKLTDVDGVKIILRTSCSGAIIKQAREVGYDGAIYAETVSVGTTALEIAGDAATGMKAITADLDPDNRKAQEVLANFRERYNYGTLPWHLGSAYDDVYITAECLKQTNDDQDADGFRDCMYGITWSGSIGDNYSFDADGKVVGLSRLVVQALPPSEWTEDRKYQVLGPAPKP